jgi:SP family general alpha glucoside:H+ symporter-like MFS transporter
MMLGSLTAMIAFIFVLFFAPNVKILLLGEILCGESRDSVAM